MLIIYSLPTCLILMVDFLVDFVHLLLIISFYTTKLVIIIESSNQLLHYLSLTRKLFK